jgi:hypothetical protein
MRDIIAQAKLHLEIISMRKKKARRHLFAPQHPISSLGRYLDVLDKAKTRASKRTPDKHNDAG